MKDAKLYCFPGKRVRASRPHPTEVISSTKEDSSAFVVSPALPIKMCCKRKNVHLKTKKKVKKEKKKKNEGKKRKM